MNLFITSLLTWSILLMSPSNTLPEIQPGDVAPMADKAMLDVVSESTQSLNDLVGENGLVVIFTSNTCPYVIAWEHTYPEISTEAKRLKMGAVLINSNEAFRGNQDTPESMRQKAEEGNYNMPYLIDEHHKVADAFGAKTTPHVFLFDGEMTLVYKGAIDDRYDGGKKEEPEANWLIDAMKNAADGQNIEPSTTRQIGCSIKRIKK
ncbi:MAG: redoxin domain-containing protein [Cryomorphaceae bacterium]|nr:redoxin domain-containing protein [Cryomorphaceae bacterium]